MKVSKEFMDAFELCMQTYDVTGDELEYEKERVRKSLADANQCYISIARGILEDERRYRVKLLLEESPDSKRAFYVDEKTDPEYVVVALAIRDVGACELLIPRGKYDPFMVIATLENLTTQ